MGESESGRLDMKESEKLTVWSTPYLQIETLPALFESYLRP